MLDKLETQLETKLCSNCQAQVPVKAKFCNKCGKREFAKTENCPKCNYAIPNADKVKFCPKCGKRIKSGKSKQKVIVAPNGEIHRCNICLRDVTEDFTVCPSCINCFHFAHLANWIIEKSECPVCKTELKLE